MFWTLSLIQYLNDAPFPCNKEELLDYAERTCAPYAVIENLLELEDEGEDYDGTLDIWLDMPIDDDDFGCDKDEL